MQLLYSLRIFRDPPGGMYSFSFDQPGRTGPDRTGPNRTGFRNRIPEPDSGTGFRNRIPDNTNKYIKILLNIIKIHKKYYKTYNKYYKIYKKVQKNTNMYKKKKLYPHSGGRGGGGAHGGIGGGGV